MEKKALEKLFYDGIMPREICCPRKKEYKQSMQLCGMIEEKLTADLSPEQVKLFEDYKNCVSKLDTMENEEHFVQGMALGIRITADAFTLEHSK